MAGLIFRTNVSKLEVNGYRRLVTIASVFGAKLDDPVTRRCAGEVDTGDEINGEGTIVSDDHDGARPLCCPGRDAEQAFASRHGGTSQATGEDWERDQTLGGE